MKEEVEDEDCDGGSNEYGVYMFVEPATAKFEATTGFG